MLPVHICSSSVKSEHYLKMFPFLSQPLSKPLFEEQAANVLSRRRFIVGLSASAAAATVLRGALTSARASLLLLCRIHQ
jgi:hypothetical protein